MSSKRGYLAARRALDVAASLAALALLSPVLAASAIAVRSTMGSPVLFRQRRTGHKGEFDVLKFRTMVNGAEQIGGGYMADALIPPVGKFLRRWSLDELPQLVNILKGDMAFVGPRPALPKQVAKYTERQAGRLAVPQGLTGLAQVRYRNNAPWSVRIESDLEYVDAIGPLTDLKLLLLTVQRVLTGQGMRMDQTPADRIDDLGKPESASVRETA